ncbi:MAG: HAD-IB family hydrolase [Patescibacteria group bacterium]|nr:HAD-IB family hydrolase [Patescibacteria group bacterium]
MTYKLLHFLLSPIFKNWIKSVKGIENIPKRGGVIIALNHKSFFDFLCFTAICPREINFLAAEKFFKSKLWFPLMKLTNQIRVNRDQKDKADVYKKVLRVLEEGKILGIFPEGTRSRSGKIQKAYPGVAKIAFLSKVPVIPVGIKGTFNILPPHRKIPRLKKCTIKIGEPVYFNKFYNRIKTGSLFRNISHFLMHNISDLSKEDYNHFIRRNFSFLKKSSSKNVVFFDVDNVLIKGQSYRLFINYLFKNKFISFADYIYTNFLFFIYDLGIIKNSDWFREKQFFVLKKIHIKKIKKNLKNYLKIIKDRIFKEALKEIKVHKKNGDIIVLFSTNVKDIIKPLVEMVDADLLVATELSLRGGYYTGKIIGYSPHGDRKVSVVQNFIKKHDFDLRNIYAYADHITDLDLLEFVRYPNVVNPDKRLKRIAKKRDWNIHNWFN